MKNLTLNVKNLISDESGQDLIEYALIASLIGLVAVTTLTSVSGAITAVFGRVVTALGPAT
ncbi:Flp family type IVb pilin [Terriglobus roseus]|uniref:Pilus assembly protein Flp/PilA n=1 Tax=Terriglobus roseus TaxID=392734 RepID=A0A1H4Q310_9BACT|nr:Flp family type IVb pilin [Terriglobus roseus]SEC13792.1 pilus assembly protein Flp/PilA [Terriglobus roseus]